MSMFERWSTRTRRPGYRGDVGALTAFYRTDCSHNIHLFVKENQQ